MLSRIGSSLKPHHDPSFTVDFDQQSTRSAGSVVEGTVNLTLDDQGGAGGIGRKAFSELRIKFGAVQHSTYQHYRPQPGPMGLSGQDYRSETHPMLESGLILWSSPRLPPSTPGASTSSSSNRPSGGKQVISLPFSFSLPTLEEQEASGFILPPSWEGGTRSQAGDVGKGRAEGRDVGRNSYYIKVTGMRTAMLSTNERVVLPFIYLPPATVPVDIIPPPIFPPPEEGDSTLPIRPPPRPLDDDGWVTVRTQKSFRESLFGKSGLVVVSLTAPALPAYPTSHPIPYYLSLIIKSPPSSSTSSQPQLRLPSPSNVKLLLNRTVLTEAQGARQNVRQLVGPVVDFGSEKRIWHGDMFYSEEYEEDEGGGRKKAGKVVGRWAREVVIVGEMRFEGVGVGPSFDRGESKQGRLACDYWLSVHVPIKGISSDLDSDNFLPVTLSSRIDLESLDDRGVWKETGGEEWLPSYFDASDEKTDIFEDEKKS
ncbi:hypothetical protein BDY24DRAFT_437387 [Mrakia frigida]|uniref:uncharacterized protein n=1 Tax=Mrakia frigida TaxID=29902 RepID=UPI003FCC0649